MTVVFHSNDRSLACAKRIRQEEQALLQLIEVKLVRALAGSDLLLAMTRMPKSTGMKRTMRLVLLEGVARM